MRLCRYAHQGQVRVGFYADTGIIPIEAAATLFSEYQDVAVDIPETDSLVELVSPGSPGREALVVLDQWCRHKAPNSLGAISLQIGHVDLLLPVPSPPKLFLLAGNYADHIQEDGSRYEERKNTFPYVFMKPPSTTLLDPCAPLPLPEVSPRHVDWEIELAGVIGKKVKDVSESGALDAVAGYTILNDISDRKFRPNPARTTRDWDKFFDWMHGKWHDGFAPCGPCLVTTDEIPDPQALDLRLSLNGELRQSGNTREQIFPFASVVAFISSFVTLEPGDIISTGTPSGVGNTTGTFLRPGDVLVATISSIGSLTTAVGGAADE